MSPMPVPSATASAAARSGDPTRERLLAAGLRLFAQQGYSTTSTREIAEAAGANVAAISYHFGDKAGLYRAVFFEPMGGSPEEEIARYAAPGLTLRQALQGFFAGMLEPLRQGDEARLCMKLHFREMLEPTGLWDDHLAHGLRPLHDALLLLLARHLGLPAEAAPADADLQRLAFCIAGLGVHLHVAQDVADAVSPGLLAPEHIEAWGERLVLFALAMLQAEAARRGLPPPAAD